MPGIACAFAEDSDDSSAAASILRSCDLGTLESRKLFASCQNLLIDTTGTTEIISTVRDPIESRDSVRLNSSKEARLRRCVQEIHASPSIILACLLVCRLFAGHAVQSSRSCHRASHDQRRPNDRPPCVDIVSSATSGRCGRSGRSGGSAGVRAGSGHVGQGPANLGSGNVWFDLPDGPLGLPAGLRRAVLGGTRIPALVARRPVLSASCDDGQSRNSPERHGSFRWRPVERTGATRWSIAVWHVAG